MAETLSKQYASVFSRPIQNLPDADSLFQQEGIDNNQSMVDIKFNQDDIIEAIDDISPTAAAGPGFPAILLKTCKNALSKPLYVLWRKSLDMGITPIDLKHSNIIPIHKGGSYAVPANYRPVALTSHIVKVLRK